MYEMTSKDDPKAWADLIKVFKVLNETPPDKLEAALVADLRRRRRAQVPRRRSGAREHRRLLDPRQRLQLVSGRERHHPHHSARRERGDGTRRRWWTPRWRPGRVRPRPRPWRSSSRNGRSGGLSPASAGRLPRPRRIRPWRRRTRSGSVGRAERREQGRSDRSCSRSRRCAHEYLSYVHEIAEKWLDWKTLGPIAQKYHALIADDVKADTRKLFDNAGFESGVESVKAFADARREYC